MTPLPSAPSTADPAPGRTKRHAPWVEWIFSAHPKTQHTIRMWMLSSFAYLLCTVLLLYHVATDMIDPRAAGIQGGAMLLAMAVFYVLLRSGYSHRFADPALTLPQVLIALTLVASVYAVTPHSHASAMMLMAFTQTFGIFNKDLKQVFIAGSYGVGLMALMMVFKSHTEPEHYRLSLEAVQVAMLAMVTAMLVWLATQQVQLRGRLKSQKAELTSAVQRLHEISIRDELTGLNNRGHMLALLAHYIALQARIGQDFCVALLDLDHFKQINDSHGHGVGDEALRCFARNVRDVLRDSDVLARWGGEEFLVLFPQGSAEQAAQSLTRVRIRLANTPVCADAAQLRIYFSAGLTVSRSGDTIDNLLERADRALYAAKAAGRNQSQIG